MVMGSPFGCFAARFFVGPEPLLARADDFIGQPLRFLGKHVHDDHRVIVESIDDSPVVFRVSNS
jgi:hypothetical protein